MIPSGATSVDDERAVLRTIADYQWGGGAGNALFSANASVRITRSSSGKPRQIHAPDGRLVTLGRDGRFTLGFAGGYRLADALSEPAYRVPVGDESEPFVRAGENAFAKFVSGADETIRPGDEVLVVHRQTGTVLAVGRAELSAAAMADFDRGVAVSIREGRDEWESD